MCWSCNPYCGNCKPPKPRPKICPECKTLNFDTPNEAMKCKKCGALLPERPPRPVVKCLFANVICANPCNKYTDFPKDGIEQPCKHHTPPKEPKNVTPPVQP